VLGSGRVSGGWFWCPPAKALTFHPRQHHLPPKRAAQEVPHHHLWAFGNGAPGRCGRLRAWRGRVAVVEVMTLLASGLHYKQRLKAEGRMSLDCESWETGVVVGSVELAGGQAKTAHASQVIGTRSSSVTSWVCEAVARAGGRAVEARTFASWGGLRTGWDVAVEEAESSMVELYQVVDCGCMCVVVDFAGSRDGRRCSGQHIDAHTGVAPDEGAQGGRFRFRLRVRASRHDLTQAYQVAATGCHAIGAVEV